MSVRRSGRRPVALLVLAFGLASLCLDSSCNQTPNVTFSISLPGDVTDDTAWIEIGAFPQDVCLTASQLAGGVPLAGPSARVVFPLSDTTPPAFGDLPKASFAFAAVARASDCSVVAQGCAIVDLSNANAVSIALAPIEHPAGACAVNSKCDDAVCVTQSDAGVGAGCSLSFIGGGPLADPLGQDTEGLSAPAIVATDTGFLLAYRENDETSGDSRLALIPLDDQGGAGPAKFIELLANCTPDPSTDAAGLAWNGTTGLVAIPCTGPTAGVNIFSVTSEGVGGSQGGLSETGSAKILSQAHSIAFTSGDGILLADIDAISGIPTVTQVINNTALGSVAQIYPFGDVHEARGAYIFATNLGTGLLSLGTPGAPSSVDAGSDGGSDDGSSGEEDGSSGDPPPTSDAGGGATVYTASFTNLVPGASLTKLPASNDFQASWLSIGGVDSRFLVATNGSPTSNPIVWYAYDVGGITPTHVDSFAPQVMGDVLYADVALVNDNALFAAEIGPPTSSVSLFAFNKASTYPQLLVEKDFGADSRIPIGTVTDGLVAVAADATRVAVVWINARNLTNLDKIGGYAIFACAP